jgi:hypothetical protein
MVAPDSLALVTANPISPTVSGGTKIYGEASGENTLEGGAKGTPDAIAQQLEKLEIRFRERG